MPVIWKFALPIGEMDYEIFHDMPRGAKVLSAGNQRENLVIWAEVVPSHVRCKRRFMILPTGDSHDPPIPVNARFVATVLFEGGGLVVHVYDCGEN